MNKLKVFGNVEDKIIDRALAKIEVEIKPNSQTYKPENGYVGFNEVIVEGYDDKLSSVEITPTREEQIIVPSDDLIGFNEIVVKPMDKSLKPYLDISKSAKRLFDNFSSMTSEQLAEFIPTYDTTENVTDMSYMLYNCNSLTNIPLLDTSKVNDMQCMANTCSNLIYVPPLDTSSCNNMFQMFYLCYKIPKIDITYFNGLNTNYTFYWCGNCYSLKAVVIRSFGSNYVLDTNAFKYCHHMLGTYNSTYNPNSDHDGYVYIPRAYMNIIPNETNWSVLQFRALEDYTKDGTTTGEFDDEKAGL